MLQWMTACHRVQVQKRHLYELVIVVSEHGDSEITVDSTYTICFADIFPL